VQENAPTNEAFAKLPSGTGKATLTTVQGGTLTAMMQGGKLVLTDEKGGTSTVTIANVIQSDGVIHVIDTVLNVLEYELPMGLLGDLVNWLAMKKQIRALFAYGQRTLPLLLSRSPLGIPPCHRPWVPHI
jgi:hypothetical protein